MYFVAVSSVGELALLGKVVEIKFVTLNLQCSSQCSGHRNITSFALPHFVHFSKLECAVRKRYRVCVKGKRAPMGCLIHSSPSVSGTEKGQKEAKWEQRVQLVCAGRKNIIGVGSKGDKGTVRLVKGYGDF